MGGVAPPPEHRVRCLPPLTKSGGDEELRLEVDDKAVGVTLRVAQLHRRLVAGLPDRALDLLELAALVYGVDAAVSRGGPMDQMMGRKWHRRFLVEMSVRDLAFWQRADVTSALEECVMFVSGDRFEFSFSRRDAPDAERSRFFSFGPEEGWVPDRVLMFSGGLDSFAGALEEIVEHKNRVALISHSSATKMAAVQRQLQNALNEHLGNDMSRHFPVLVQIKSGGTKEATHRSRSFLFASLGAIIAQAFGQNRVSFHENGAVSLNLPPVGNVMGTRATRTTHPRTLRLFTDFFSLVFSDGMRVANPFFWRTKTDVVKVISRLGEHDQIARTRSCADIHNQTKQYAHCGRCSQCIDRRFALLAAGLTEFDPEEAYHVPLMLGERLNVRDRETALSYIRNAEVFEHIKPEDLMARFPAVLDAVNSLGEPAPTSLSRIADLLKRHGGSVSGVMRDMLDNKPADAFPANSLPRLYGEMQRDRVLTEVGAPALPLEDQASQPMLVEIDRQRETVVIDKAIELRKSKTSGLIIALATEHLNSAGQGLDPLDYTCLPANILAMRLELTDGEAVRQRIKRSRSELRKKFSSTGFDPEEGAALIETNPGRGYRLAPDRVLVREHDEDWLLR